MTYALEFKHLTVNQGLSHRRVYAIASDLRGFMWFATRTGVDRYDGREFVHYNLSDDPKVSDGYTNTYCIITDNDGTVWAISPNGKLFAYSYRLGSFVFKAKVNYEEKTTIWDNFLYCDSKNNIWVVTSTSVVKYDTHTQQASLINIPYDGARLDGIMEMGGRFLLYSNNGITSIIYDEEAQEYRIQKDKLSDMTPNLQIKKLMFDSVNNTLWLGTYSKGLQVIDLNRMRFLNVPMFTEKKIREMVVKDDNTVFLGVDGAGVYTVDRNNFKVIDHYWSDVDNPRSLSGNGVYDIHIDAENRIWICSYTGGVDIYDPILPSFKYIKRKYNNPNTITHNEVNFITEDSNGNIWYATNNGLSLFNSGRNSWEHFLKNDDPSQSSVIKVCKQDNDGNMWVGTYANGMYVIDMQTKRVTDINKMFAKDSLSKFVYTIYCDDNGDVWSGSLYEPLTKINLGKGTVTKYPGDDQIKSIAPKNDNELYIGSNSGVFVFNKHTGRYSDNIVKLDANLRVTYVYPLENNLWVGTEYYGLVKYDVNNGKTRVFSTRKGLPSNFISSMIHDNNGRLWVTTETGLAYISLENESVVNYTYKELLTNYEFNNTASAKLRDGRLVMGTAQGALIFDPAEISPPKLSSNLIFTDILVEEESIYSLPKSILKKPLDQTESLVFKFRQNILNFKFISLDYSPFNNVLYSWKLDGVDADWTTPSRNNSAAYVKIPPGDYTFKVRTMNPNNLKQLEVRTMNITIQRPIWNSIFAWFVYSLILCGLAYLVYRFYAERTEKRHSDDKIRFFINTAHDLKTPITLIKAPLMDIGNDTNLSADTRKYLDVALNNINKLQEFIDKLLDFERRGAVKTKLLVREITLSEYITTAVSEFKLQAEHKNLSLSCRILKDTMIWIDRDVMDSIITNLLTNAIKYTPNGGEISVVADSSNTEWSVEVTDSGIGIPRSDQKRLFSRFYRAENATNSQVTGTGIGLMLVKNLAKQHGGSISFKSAEGVGSVFTLKFPIGKDLANVHFEEATPVDDSHKHALNFMMDLKVAGKPVIVLAEDNQELREYLSHALDAHYTVYAADCGEAAYEMVLHQNPDLVITDMMMPGIKGDELCRKIKTDIITSHIPVILLTVVSDREDMLGAFGCGADDYITKPFDIALLKLRIENRLKTQSSFRKYVSKMVELPKTDEVIGEADNQLIHRVINIIYENISNTDFSVNMLSTQMHMSRSGFFNKIKAITGETPVDFIKVIRMKRAAELLREGKYNVNEVSEMVGFQDAKYFSTAFKKYYGTSPSKFV